MRSFKLWVESSETRMFDFLQTDEAKAFIAGIKSTNDQERIHQLSVFLDRLIEEGGFYNLDARRAAEMIVLRNYTSLYCELWGIPNPENHNYEIQTLYHFSPPCKVEFMGDQYNIDNYRIRFSHYSGSPDILYGELKAQNYFITIFYNFFSNDLSIMNQKQRSDSDPEIRREAFVDFISSLLGSQVPDNMISETNYELIFTYPRPFGRILQTLRLDRIINSKTRFLGRLIALVR